MLCSTKDLGGFRIVARDGEIGTAREVYFDDARWVVRHVVADTGGWLRGRLVLISPHSIERLDRGGRQLAVSLTRQQVEDAPGIETDKPSRVSRKPPTTITTATRTTGPGRACGASLRSRSPIPPPASRRRRKPSRTSSTSGARPPDRGVHIA